MLTIRAVREGDAEPLRRLRLRALAQAPEAFGATVDEEQAHPAEHWLDLARLSAVGDATVVYVAIDDGRWLGMAAGRWYERDRGIAGLWGMWVDPSLRGRGVGERLVRTVRDWAADRNARFLRLGVVRGHEDPTAFYERLGFVRTGEVGTLKRDPAIGVAWLVRPV
ncbi:MAG: GNAT family N-acetyltransferase [Solirubrobacteraceae bacterium]